jgi:hypothetical protein
MEILERFGGPLSLIEADEATRSATAFRRNTMLRGWACWALGSACTNTELRDEMIEAALCPRETTPEDGWTDLRIPE